MCIAGDRDDKIIRWVSRRTKTTADREYTLYSTVLQLKHMVLCKIKTTADRIYMLYMLYSSILQLKQMHTPRCLNRADKRAHSATARSFVC